MRSIDLLSEDLTPKNRLAEFMAKKKITSSQLAKQLGTSKQNISNWRLHARQMDVSTAFQIQQAIGVPWPLILGWHGNTPPESPQEDERTLQSIGMRIAWARGYRELSVAEAAQRFGMTAARLKAIEEGNDEPHMVDITTIVAKLKFPSDFLLMGDLTVLSKKVSEAWETYIKELRFVPLERRG